MTKHFLEFDGLTIAIHRKPIKNLHLRIYPPDGEVRVSAPLRLSLEKISHQIESRREWIHTQRLRIQSRPIKPEPVIETGASHLFLGQIYLLALNETANKQGIALTGNLLQLSLKPNTSVETREAMLETWYRKQMMALLPDLITKWQAVIGVHVAEWGIKKMRTRWGSCNIRAHRIWLNLALIKKPVACLESVLVHEMVHLLEASHNARFYALMDKFMPEWRVFQKDLKCNL